MCLKNRGCCPGLLSAREVPGVLDGAVLFLSRVKDTCRCPEPLPIPLHTPSFMLMLCGNCAEPGRGPQGKCSPRVTRLSLAPKE